MARLRSNCPPAKGSKPSGLSKIDGQLRGLSCFSAFTMKADYPALCTIIVPPPDSHSPTIFLTLLAAGRQMREAIPSATTHHGGGVFVPNQELRDPNEKLSLQLHSLRMKSSIETSPGMSMLMHWQHLPSFHPKITPELCLWRSSQPGGPAAVSLGSQDDHPPSFAKVEKVRQEKSEAQTQTVPSSAPQKQGCRRTGLGTGWAPRLLLSLPDYCSPLFSLNFQDLSIWAESGQLSVKEEQETLFIDQRLKTTTTMAAEPKFSLFF